MKNKQELPIVKKYHWNPYFRNPIAHKDINLVVAELDAITEIRGKVTPDFLLDAATNKKSIFHSYFQWDNEKAAHEFRLEQARKLLRHIEITVITNGETKTSRAYEVVSRDEKSNEYKNVQLLTSDNIDFIKKVAIVDLEKIRKKLSFYDSFNKSVNFIILAIEELGKESTETKGEDKPVLTAVV